MTQLRTKNWTRIAQFIAIFGLALAYCGCGDAWGSAASDAQQLLNKAYNDYYTALRTGPTKTPDQQAKLRNDIIAPAERNLNRAMQQDTAKFDANKLANRPGNTGTGNVDNGPTSNYGPYSGPYSGPSAYGGSAASVETPTTAVTESAPIEGSEPKVYEFPGAPPKPSPSPSPKRKFR